MLDNRYIFEYDVGQWTFGNVQVLKERETGDMKTCKVVKKSVLRYTTEVMPRLKALQHIQHPHIASITDVLEDRDHIYILSDYFQGNDLQDWMERLDEGNWLQENACAAYIRQALLAVAHCHANQVYHRDLRPNNLVLTSKLPDAKIKVTDFGLAGILDPDNLVVKSQTSPYQLPEVLESSQDRGGAADIWSIGAIAHALLVGEPPDEGVRTVGWSLSRKSSTHEEAWSERSTWSEDFAKRSLRRSGVRPTAAKLLWHPWLKELTPLSGSAFRAETETAREIRHKFLCYQLAVLMVPVAVPHQDFDQLRVAFQRVDEDNDGLIPRPVAQKLLLQRKDFVDAVAAALSIVDLARSEHLDLCAVAAADLLVREFMVAGPTHAPLCGPFRATDLIGKMNASIFRSFGEGRSDPMSSVINVASLRAKVRTATGRDLEQYTEVCFDDLLDCLPQDQSIDGQTLTSCLSASEGRGTPLGVGDRAALSPIKDSSSWELPSNPFGLDLAGMFGSCGVGARRDDSPHSMRVF